MTAYQYINSPQSKLPYRKFAELVNEVYSKQIAKEPNSAKQLRQKIYYLTTDFNFGDEKNSKPKFVNRNLVDTRYATTEVYNYLNDLRQKLVDNPLNHVKLKVLNGSHTD
jgi:CRISPR-associated endonuclease Csn1